MPFLAAINELRVLICDGNIDSANRLSDCLNGYPQLVQATNIASSLDDAIRVLASVEVNAIFIDPISIGVKEASSFVFNARQKMPSIVFVLYVDPSKVKQTSDFYTGDRKRWRHYFMLSKERSNLEFAEDVFNSLHLCLSDVRLADSLTRTRLQREFVTQSGPLTEIQESLGLFRQRFSHPQKTAFIMMQFGNTAAHSDISQTLKTVLDGFGIIGLRGDDYEFHADLFYNVLTYIYGCDFGIAVFERITEDNFNPNVSFEVGYMLALRKPICLLKDRNLKTLHADLIGKLYRPFDPYDLRNSISGVMKKWMADRAFPFSDSDAPNNSNPTH